MITDPTLIRIGQAVQRNHQGEREAASSSRRSGTRSTASKGIRCTFARSRMRWRDAQDDLREELLWDLRALSAADLLTDARMTQAGVGRPAGGLYPSLHLNLSECYRKLGDLYRAREHFQQAEYTIGALGDDEYGRMIKHGMDQIAERLR